MGKIDYAAKRPATKIQVGAGSHKNRGAYEANWENIFRGHSNTTADPMPIGKCPHCHEVLTEVLTSDPPKCPKCKKSIAVEVK